MLSITQEFLKSFDLLTLGINDLLQLNELCSVSRPVGDRSLPSDLKRLMLL